MPKYNWVDESGLIRDARVGLGDTRSMQPLRALSFNGTNQYGWIAIDPVTEFPFTIFGWAKKSNTTLQTICGISSHSNGAKYFNLRIDDGDRVDIYRRNTSDIFDTATITPLINQWSSFVCIFDSDTKAKVYRNGILVADYSGLTSVLTDSSFNRFQFATRRASGPDAFLEGIVKHVGFLRRVATEQDAIDFHTTGIIYDAEVFLPLEDNSTTVAYNIGKSASWWMNEPRTNLFGFPEFPNGTADLSTSTNSTASGPISFGPLGTVNTIVAGDNTLQRVLYKSFIPVPNETYCLSMYVRMDDLSVPVVGTTSSSGDFSLISWSSISSNNVTVTHVGDNVYRVSASRSENSSDSNWGILKYVTQSSKSFKATGFMLNLGTTPLDYVPFNHSGIEYPEATLVNAPTIYEGRDVPFSLSNKHGYSTRKNRFIQTNNITSATGWNPVNITPTFLNNYTLIRETAATGEHRFYSSFSRVVGQRQTINIWVKPEGRSRLVIADSANGVYTATFNLDTQTVSSIAGNGISINASVVADNRYGTGVYRCTIKFTDPGEPPASTSARTVMLRLVNGAGATSYTGDVNLGITIFNVELRDGDVDPAYQIIGINPGASVIFPALLEDTAKSSAKDSLTYRGICPNNAQLLQSACFNFDGVDDYISIPSLTGSETVISKQGTSSLTISSGRIDGTAGTLYNLKLSNGMYLPCSEGGGSQLHCVNTNQAFDIVNGQEDNWLESQDDYHYNILEGFSYKDELLYDNKTLYYDGVILTYAN